MMALLRIFLATALLLSSGAFQLAVGLGNEDCCAGKAEESGAPDCPSGLVCACCPAIAVVQPAAIDVARDARYAAAVPLAAHLPLPAEQVADIFHPPRG